MPEVKVMEEYVRNVLECLGEGSLTKIEELLGGKLHGAQEEAGQIGEKVVHLNEGILQAQASVVELSQQRLELMSKATGFAESLIVLQFGDQIEKEAAQNPPKKRAKKRTKKSKTRALRKR